MLTEITDSTEKEEKKKRERYIYGGREKVYDRHAMSKDKATMPSRKGGG